MGKTIGLGARCGLVLALGCGLGGCPLPDADLDDGAGGRGGTRLGGGPDIVDGKPFTLPTPAGGPACGGFGGGSALAFAAPGSAPSLGPTTAQLSGPAQRAEVPPPPISGGTLLASRDGQLLVAADPDRDQLYFVDSQNFTLLHVRTLDKGDEPGRLAEDSEGRIHVALRGGRSIATLTREVDSTIERREVCDLPRGLAYDAASDQLHVACAEGKLVSLPAAGGAITRSLDVGRDARDVIVRNGELYVTHFRSAELVKVAQDGSLSEPIVPPTMTSEEAVVRPDADGPGCGKFEMQRVDQTPTVAWRAIDMPGQGITMLHQRARLAEVQVTQGGYGAGGRCSSGIVQTAITSSMEGKMPTTELPNMALAVDIAADTDGVLLAVVAPGNWANGMPQVQVVTIDGQLGVASPASRLGPPPSADVPQPGQGGASGGASVAGAGGTTSSGPGLPGASSSECLFPDQTIEQPQGQATAVTFISGYMLAVQEREPAAISFIDTRNGRVRARLDLKQPSRFDTGHAIFHMAAGANIACASCHAESGDDAHVWTFHGIGARRTQNLRGGILGTEPLHWNGDMANFPTLVKEVFVGRMGGFAPLEDQTDALAHWIDEQPELRTAGADSEAVARGKTLFESEAVGCASCHNGELFTNNRSADVGTGAVLQVPALRGVMFRGPWMHDGCAKTLRERFGTCGGGDQHGRTSQLSEPQLNDLVSYLETL